MKKTICLLLIIFFGYACSSNSASQDQVVQGKIQNNSEYESGANPSPEILAALAIYKPTANQTFYVRSAANYAPFTPVLYTFTTNANGNFTTTLPIGTYAVLGQKKYTFEQNPLANAGCAYLHEPDFLLTVVANPPTYLSVFTEKANYCLGNTQ